MDLTLSAEQDVLVRTVGQVVDRRAKEEPLPVRTFDGPSLEALASNGLLDVIASGGSALDAVLVVEEAGRHGVTAPVAARALIAPLMLAGSGVEVGHCVGLLDRRSRGLARFGEQADQFLVLDGNSDEALVVSSNEVTTEHVHSRWGFPVARIEVNGGKALGAGSAARLRRLWRIALAAEASGLMGASVIRAAEHVSQRYQFGRAIGSYQAIQHRLARSKVIADGTMWLARKAAWDTTDDLAASMAATYGGDGMKEVASHVQQVCGAVGITDEFGLTRMSQKLLYLATELGGPTAHAIAYSRERFLTGRVDPRRVPGTGKEPAHS